MLSFLVAIRNFVLLVILAWLGVEYAPDETPDEDTARAAIVSLF